MPAVYLINFGSEQVDTLAREGWSAKEISAFSGLSPYQVRRLCRHYPDGPGGWIQSIHRRKARLARGQV